MQEVEDEPEKAIRLPSLHQNPSAAPPLALAGWLGCLRRPQAARGLCNPRSNLESEKEVLLLSRT